MKLALACVTGLLVVAAVFAIWPAFGAPWIAGDEPVSELTPAGKCQEARLYRQLLEDPAYRERSVAAGVANTRYYRSDMTEERLRQAEQAQYDSNLSLWAASIEFWCER